MSSSCYFVQYNLNKAKAFMSRLSYEVSILNIFLEKDGNWAGD